MAKEPDKAEGEGRRLAMGPVPVARLVAATAKPLLRRSEGALARLALDWAEVVGPDARRRSPLLNASPAKPRAEGS
ncbi:MAG: hypothetical protein RML45_09685 [Acetobacteraceae bacterium]|nr:hypothetical protein [Acetobacteraceae bacterium]